MRGAYTGSDGMQGTQFNIDSMQRTTDDVSQCTPSVECGDYRNEAAAVVDIYAIDMRLGAMGLCTGDPIQPGPSDEGSFIGVHTQLKYRLPLMHRDLCILTPIFNRYVWVKA